MDDCQVCYGSNDAISILHPFDVEGHTVTLHHGITVYNDMFDHMAGVMRAFARKKTRWKEDLFFAVKLARQNLFKYYSEVTPTTSMILISAKYLNPFRKLRSFRKWDKGMDINPEDETSYTTQYQEAFLKYVENEYCARHQHVPVNTLETVPSSNLIPSAMASRSYQSRFDTYDLSSNDEESLMRNNVAETTPRPSDHAACLTTAARLYLNSPPEALKNCGQINPNLNDYHSDSMEISSTFWSPDITDWWRHQEVKHSKYTDLSNVAHGHILHHTTWCRTGGQFFPWLRCYWLEASKNHRQDPSRKSHCQPVRSSQ